MTIPCPACQGTGNMDPERAEQLSAIYRQPVCWRYGCEDCGGYGTIEQEENGE